MKHETKLLTFTLGIFLGIAGVGLGLEKIFDWDKPFNPLYAHVEVHTDRPLDEAIKESAYERASDEERAEYDAKESSDRSIEADFEGGKWVSVDDIYPPAHGRVLIYAVNGHFKTWRYVN